MALIYRRTLASAGLNGKMQLRDTAIGTIASSTRALRNQAADKSRLASLGKSPRCASLDHTVGERGVHVLHETFPTSLRRSSSCMEQHQKRVPDAPKR